MKILFTQHAQERMQKRKISKAEILDAINHPDNVSKKKGKYFVQKNILRANIEVVYEKENYIKIITVYYPR